MREAILNVIKVLTGLVLIALSWYSIGYGFADVTNNPNLFFLGGFAIFGLGVGIIIYVIKNAKN